MAAKVKVKTVWGKKSKKTDVTIAAKTLGGALKELQKRDEWGEFKEKINYSYSDGGGSFVAEVVLKPSYSIRMPKWTGYSKAPKECQQEWDRMWEKLDEHEDGHKDIHLETVKTMENTLKAKTDLTSAQLDTDFNKMMDAGQKKQAAFDASTGYGSKKGVTLNVSAACT